MSASTDRLKRNLLRMRNKMEKAISVLDQIGHPKSSRVIIAPIFFGGNLHVYTKQYSEALVILNELQMMQSKLKAEIESKKIIKEMFFDSQGFIWLKDIAYANLDILIEKISGHRSHKSVMYRLIELSDKIHDIIKLL